MASSVIHMCVAKKINEQLHLPEKMLLLGAIAPDISKHLNETKTQSHFYNMDQTVNIDRFLDKYKYKLNDTFMIGYFIHLYTDLIWDKYFESDIFVSRNIITLIDGSKYEGTYESCRNLIYNDYTNLDVKLLDEYNMDLSLFYEDLILPNYEIDEIPIKKLSILTNHISVVISNNEINKAYVFNMPEIKAFIETTANLVYSRLIENQK